MWRRWQAVAAVGLMTVVSSLTCWFWFSPAADLLEHQGRQLAQQEMSAVLREERMSLSVAEPMPVVESETEMVAVVMRQDGKSLSNKTVSGQGLCVQFSQLYREKKSRLLQTPNPFIRRMKNDSTQMGKRGENKKGYVASRS